MTARKSLGVTIAISDSVMMAVTRAYIPWLPAELVFLFSIFFASIDCKKREVGFFASGRGVKALDWLWPLLF